MLSTNRKKAKKMYAILRKLESRSLFPEYLIEAVYSSKQLAKENLNNLLPEEIEENGLVVGRILVDHEVEF